MAIAPIPVDALPTPPSLSNPSTFDSLADSFIAAFVTFRAQTNALATNVYVNALECLTNVNTANAAANAATAAVNVAVWVSGTTYAIGNVRYSPLTLQSYRRKTAGSGTTDPALDTDNWASLGGSSSTGFTIYAAQNFGGF